MGLPEPATEFSLGSIHDNTQLECRIYHPKNDGHEMSMSDFEGGAVVSHPYAPLGGCFDDHVVLAVVAELLHAGLVVATFNFRGAGSSSARSSWSAKPEVADYETVAGFVIHYLHQLQNLTGRTGDGRSVSITLAGYSYGSMVVSMLHNTRDLCEQFEDPSDEAAAQVVREARAMAKAHVESHFAGKTIQADEDKDSDLSNLKVTTNYLLISNPLPPISAFIAPLSRHSLLSASPEHLTNLTENRTLAVYGTEDGFVSSRRANKWCEKLAQVKGSKLRYEEIQDAGHFWREMGVLEALQETIRSWVDSHTVQSKIQPTESIEPQHAD